MRSHGIADFPDPNSQGQIAIRVTSTSDLNPSNPQFQAADQACHALKPSGEANPQQQQQFVGQLLQFSQCMRSHGIANFPDPQTLNGSVMIQMKAPGMDPNSPTFQAAQQACQSLLPNKVRGIAAPSG